MKKIKLLMFILLSLPCISAGVSITGTVRDSSGQGVPYVNAGIIGTGYGTVTGVDGVFRIVPDEYYKWQETDSVRFSSVGYFDRTVPLKNPGSDGFVEIHVTLIPRQYMLSEVPVISAGLVRKTTGNTNTTTTMSNNMAISSEPGQNLGAEVGRKFNLGKDVNHLQKLNFFVKYCNYDTVVLRVNIYKLKSGKPAERLVNENMVFTVVKHRKGWVSFDLSDRQIIIREPVVVAVEWVGHSVKGNLFGFPISVPAPGAVHYYKFGSQSEWKRYVSMSTAMNIEYLTEP